ncbi:HEPN domain-containing protein [Methanospirillum sp.]|nr:HEPN domain-containing protein [Methanospirillum sp.]
MYPDAVNRAYYAIFHAALALLLEHGVVVKTHTWLISRFGQMIHSDWSD